MKVIWWFEAEISFNAVGFLGKVEYLSCEKTLKTGGTNWKIINPLTEKLLIRVFEVELGKFLTIDI